MPTKFFKQSKGASGLVFLIIIVIAVIIAIFVFKMLTKPVVPPPDISIGSGPEEPPPLVFEVTLGNVKLKLVDAKDRGDTLRGSESNYPTWKKDLRTKEKFVMVTIGAENLGTEYIEERSWDIEEIVDSNGRKFQPISEARDWLPENNQCQTLLKPGFSPSPCTKIYEAAKVSSGLKIKVYAKEGKQEKKEDLIDLGF